MRDECVYIYICLCSRKQVHRWEIYPIVFPLDPIMTRSIMFPALGENLIILAGL